MNHQSPRPLRRDARVDQTRAAQRLGDLLWPSARDLDAVFRDAAGRLGAGEVGAVVAAVRDETLVSEVGVQEVVGEAGAVLVRGVAPSRVRRAVAEEDHAAGL